MQYERSRMLYWKIVISSVATHFFPTDEFKNIDPISAYGNSFNQIKKMLPQQHASSVIIMGAFKMTAQRMPVA